MTAYPSLASRQDQALYKEGSKNPAKRDPVEGGYDITRRQYTRRPRITFTTGYTNLSNADKLALQAHWNAVGGSSDAFDWPNPITGEFVTVRFGDMPELPFVYSHYRRTPSGEDDHRWNVTFTVEEV